MAVDPLLDLIRDHVAQLGFELVDLRRTGTPGRAVVKVRVDRPGSTPGHGITTEECVTVSRALERALEAGGHVGPTYVLEVSSPGIERPVRFPAHWRRYVGERVRVRAAGLPGKPVVRIAAVPDDGHVELELADGSRRTVALADVHDAHLVVDWGAVTRKR